VRIIHSDENGKKGTKLVMHGVLSVMCVYNKDQANGNCGSYDGAKIPRTIDLQFKGGPRWTRVESWRSVCGTLYCLALSVICN